MLNWPCNGAQLAWLLVPETETTYLYRPSQPEPEIVQGFDDELSGETVLPGFRRRLAELR